MYVLALLHSFDKFVQDIFLADEYVCFFPFASGTINELWLQSLLTLLSPLESKEPLQSRLLNTPIFIPFWDGPSHPSKCRKKLILICFKALQLSLIQVVPILKLHSELHAGAPVSLPFLKDNQSVCVYYVSLLVCLCVCSSVCLKAYLLARHVRPPGH